jgi:hypothetical protein
MFSKRHGLKQLADPDVIDKKWPQLAAEANATTIGGKEDLIRSMLFLQSIVARKLGIYWTAASSKRWRSMAYVL